VSKRLDREIGAACDSAQEGTANLEAVTRRSRLAIATLGQPVEQGGVRVAHVFDRKKVKARKSEEEDVGTEGASEQAREKEPEWNGTLLGERRALEAIGRLLEHKKQTKAEKYKRRLHWWLIVSLEMQPQGPWIKYAQTTNLKLDQRSDELVIAPRNSRDEWRGLAYPFRHPCNEKGRQGLAKHQLSRLPGLRVLSVDLGHRYAAACAVWETLAKDSFEKIAPRRRKPSGARDAECKPEEAIYPFRHRRRSPTPPRRRHEGRPGETTIYRRIGADTLPDGKPHPAPWARLDRQFLIKLQGEAEGAREASNEEIWAVHEMETVLGRSVPLIDRLVTAGWGSTEKQKARLDAIKKLGWVPIKRADASEDADTEEEEELAFRPSLSVDDLMSSAVRTMRLALKRHGDRARIAFAMTAAYKPMPGDRRYYFTESKDLSATEDATARNSKHIEFIQDALLLWYGLISSRGWRDEAARQLWDDHVAKLHGYKAPEEIGEDVSGAEREKKQKENREKLYDVGKALAQNESLRKTLHHAWKTRWEEDDGRWKKQLRWFKDWILPRGKYASDPSIRKVGGLSLTRLATLTEFRRKVQVGFFTRLKPDGTRAETKEQFGQSTLDALEHLREQRVKQLASRIVEAALGIGSENKQHWEGGKRPRARSKDPRFAPCHAVVIEDLTHYRPEETRTRRENRQLMSWSSSKVKKYLAEACQLHGLHLREVSAGYTSRQDSRTGAPGIRCHDVPVKEFMRSPFWRKQVAQAEKKQDEGKGDARERFLCDLNAKWKGQPEADWEKAGAVRVPLKGGEIFVSADQNSPAAKGLHADLNAAANIGLRVLTDPDWPGKWWYVPCDPVSFLPVKDKVEGSAVVKPDQPLPKSAQAQSGDGAKDKKKPGKRGASKSKESKKVVNLWCDISSSPLECREWKEYAAYQNEVQSRVIHILEKQIKRLRQATARGVQ
jgi:IS605 OrfB family transposase